MFKVEFLEEVPEFMDSLDFKAKLFRKLIKKYNHGRKNNKNILFR